MLDNYIEILQQYKNPKLQYLFSSLPLPSQWQLFQTANKIDVLNSQTDYLIDLIILNLYRSRTQTLFLGIRLARERTKELQSLIDVRNCKILI